MPRNRSRINKKGGFTFIELLVVLALVVLLLSVVVTQDRTHAGKLLSDDVAYRIALSIREVQSYGISAKEYRAPGGGSETFCAGYGIVFSMANPTRYDIFVDLVGPPGVTFECPVSSVVYDVGSDVILERVTMKRGQITLLCIDDGLGNRVCGNTLNIGYQRPNPYPKINGVASNSSAQIVVSFPGGIDRTIEVRPTGQISVF